MRRDRSGTEHLKRLALFSACTRKELELIAGAMTELRFPAGETLALQGQNGHEFMVIADGTARVEISGRTISTLGPGDFFGEIAMLDGGPCTATVIAETATWLLRSSVSESSPVSFRTLPNSWKRPPPGLARRLACC